MNRYPTWLNFLVLGILLCGIVLALPNVYGTVPAVQVASIDGSDFGDAKVEEVVDLLQRQDIAPEEAYVEDGRVVVRFHSVEEQLAAGDFLRERFDQQASTALTLAPKLPAWVRALGLNPMSLGLDLRGGVYFLLEVDMETAIDSRLALYQQSIGTILREERVRHRVDLDGRTITVRLTSTEDRDRARNLIRQADNELLIADAPDGRSLTIRMSEQQIAARQNFAIEQNITTLRNRVNQLGVSEPLVQRQGADRIVVQLPGVQDPNRLDDILTATATLEFRLVDTTGDSPGSRRYPGRSGEPAQILQRDIVASGDQIVDAESGFSEGQPAVFINLDAAGGESMLRTTRANLNKPMSTVFIETRRETITRNGEEQYRTIKTEEIINTATIR
ncbi:MAG TPA: protein translocase subunit SecD, partial [Woeseiaceae bacterium]|nr:protein translocase subunit SecD [Woeseiaceae bacterium]